MAPGSLKAVVITGDVIASSRLKATQRKKLQTRIDEFARDCAQQYADLQLQQYRGDSLQATLTKSRKDALNIALQLYSFLKAADFHIRLGLGIGEISFHGKDIITSDGSAFQLSGPLTDELKKKNELIAISATEAAFAAEWAVHSASLNFLLQRLSPAQAEALYLHLQNSKQENIAKTLRISQPSVHQRLQAAGVQVFTSIVARFESTILLL